MGNIINCPRLHNGKSFNLFFEKELINSPVIGASKDARRDTAIIFLRERSPM